MKARYGTPEWDRAHALAQCWAHNVSPAVFDFIQHNLGSQAAFAALRALPICPPTASGVPSSVVLAVDFSRSIPNRNLA